MEAASIFWTWIVLGLYALLHLTALSFALVYYRRCAAACSLVLTASILGLLANAAEVGVTTFWRHDLDNVLSFTYLMMGITTLNWCAYGLMIVAVFAGRNQTPPTWSPQAYPHDDDDTEDWNKPATPSAGVSGGTGFQERK